MSLVILQIGLAALIVLLIVQLYFLRRQRDTLDQENKILKVSKNELENYVALDDLTTAQSRRYLADRIDRERRTDIHSLLFLDIDEFKTVNDGYGHDYGDELLIKITESLVETCRPNDFVARLGGDEFCIYLDKCDLEQATEVAERFREAASNTTIIVKGAKVKRTASIGVSELKPNQSMVDALHVADAALYQAKAAGRNQIKAAQDDVLQQLRTRRSKPTLEQMTQALKRGEIIYYVQPIFDLVDERVIGVEALMRWVTPSGEVRLPEDFFDVLSANYRRDVRPPLEAANTLASVFQKFDPPIFCAWNISSSFLRRNIEPDAVWVDELLQGINPKQAMFEIVENAVIDNPERTRELLSRLRGAGARVALDDFGTGLSNLERLMELPVDTVKVDRSFVQGMDQGVDDGMHLKILRGLVAMSQTMGFDIIAEGVETPEQLQMLKEVGITKGQGFLLGRPNTVEYWQERLHSNSGFDL